MTDIYYRTRSAIAKILRKLGLIEARKPTKAQRRAAKRAAKRAEKDAARAAKNAGSTTPVVETAPEIPVIGWLPTTFSPERPNAELHTKVKDYRKLAKRYAYVITEATALHDHHSITPGRSDWADKWRSCQGRRILYFTVSDYSGSFYRWAEAVNRHTPHAVRMISLTRHRFGYPLDILSLRGDLLVDRFPNALHDILSLADEADIIHIKDQTGFWDGRNNLPKTLLTQFRKPMVYTLYGGTARKDESDPGFQAYVNSHDAVIAMTPDLCFEWSGAEFIPHNIDEEKYPFCWQDGKLILHTPSSPHRKGTELFDPAARMVASAIGGKVEIITGTKHDYVMRHKSLATIFFDQAGRETDENGGKLIGWYGNSALEAAVFGVPTMAHLSREAIERANRAGYDVEKESKILNVDPTEDGIYSVLNSFFEESESHRRDRAASTRRWIEKVHSYKATSVQLSAVYERL